MKHGGLTNQNNELTKLMSDNTYPTWGETIKNPEIQPQMPTAPYPNPGPSSIIGPNGEPI